MLRNLTLLVLLVMVPRAVFAKPMTKKELQKELQANFEKFINSITDDPKTAALQGTQIILLPDAANGIVTAPTGLSTKDILGAAATGPVTWKIKVLRATTGFAYSNMGAIAADVDALDKKTKKKLATLRVSAEMLTEDAKKPGLVLAVQFSLPLADDKAAQRVLDGKEPKAAAFAEGLAPAAKAAGVKDPEMNDAAGEIAELTKDKFASAMSNGGIVIGSAPSETYTDYEKIKKWKLELAPDGKIMYGGSTGDNGALWVACNIKIKRTFKGKPVEQIYRALFLYEVIVSGEGGSISLQLDVAHFASPT